MQNWKFKLANFQIKRRLQWSLETYCMFDACCVWVARIQSVFSMPVKLFWSVWVNNSMWPGDTVWRHTSKEALAQIMACCLTAPSHDLNQCWLLIGEVFGIRMKIISHWVPKILFCIMSLKIILLNSLSQLPAANDLNHNKSHQNMNIVHKF